MLNLDPYNSQIRDLCEQFHVKRLDLFGSSQSNDFDATSDIDVLVEFDRSYGHLFTRYFDLKERLEAVFERPVDLVMAEAIRNPYFKSSVERSRHNVYSA